MGHKAINTETEKEEEEEDGEYIRLGSTVTVLDKEFDEEQT